MAKLDNMIYGDNPREGFTKNGFFYHPEMKFQFSYPENWQIINQRSLVAVVSEGQDAVSIMTLDSESSDAEASVNEFLNQEGITTVRKETAETNGLSAFQAEATGQTEDGIQLKFYLYSIEYNSSVYRFLSYTTLEKYEAYGSVFAEITGGFNELKDASILNIQPVHLEVVKVNRSGTFISFLPKNLESFSILLSPEDLAIMNQVELDEQINTGTWLKLPRQ